MYQRLLAEKLPRNGPFCLFGAKGTGKTTLIRNFAGKFSNYIHLDLETAIDRSIFNFEVSFEETLKAIGFLKDKEIRGTGTLIVLDEICRCPGAIRWFNSLADKRSSKISDISIGGGNESNVPLIVATSSFMTKESALWLNPDNGLVKPYFLYPFSFEEFLMAMDNPPMLEAFREAPVPGYAYEKLLNYFHLYALIGGMPEIAEEYAENRHLAGLKSRYKGIEERFISCLQDVTAGAKSRDLAVEVLQNTYPFAATRISFNRFGNLEKGSREIRQAFNAIERAFFLEMMLPVTAATLPLAPDASKFPRLQLVDTGLVNYFSGIQKPLFQSHDMNAIFEGQIARQVVGQEILASEVPGNGGAMRLNFWVRNKAQSMAEVDFVIQYDDLLIPVVVKSGEAGRLRSLHQFLDLAPHTYAVRLYAGKLAVQQTQTIRGKKFFLLNLPYFLAGKIREHLRGFIRLANGRW